MSQSPNAASLSAAEAAAALLWLREMGADEILGADPVNRFAAPPPVVAAAPPRAAPPRPSAPPSPPPPQPRAALEAEASMEQVHAAARQAPTLAALAELLDTFQAHPLRRTASRLCFTEATPGARILVMCDRPRSEEDRSGKIFADKHEVLFQRMLAAIGLGGEAGVPVSLLSFLPWRPPGNRPPTELECRMILPFAERALALLQPQIILAFGGLPGQWLAGGAESIQRQRGTWLTAGNVPLLSTFHPESLLKSPALKRLAWLDLLAFRAKLDASA